MKLPIIILVKLYWDTHDITTSKDRLLRDYNIVLMESAIVASFDGFLFGSLLNVSVRNANQVIYSENYPQNSVIFYSYHSITFCHACHLPSFAVSLW
jgi:hypothetical protein